MDLQLKKLLTLPFSRFLNRDVNNNVVHPIESFSNLVHFNVIADQPFSIFPMLPVAFPLGT